MIISAYDHKTCGVFEVLELKYINNLFIKMSGELVEQAY